MSRLDLLIEYIRNNCPGCSVAPWNAPQNDGAVLPILESMRSGDYSHLLAMWGEHVAREAIVARNGRVTSEEEVQAEVAKIWGARMTTEQTRAMFADEAGLRAAFEAVRVHSLGYVGEDYRLAADQTLAGMVEMYGRFDHGMKRLIDRAYQGLSPLNP